MNKYIRLALVSFGLGLLLFGVLTFYGSQGISYSPGIEASELDGLSYQEGSELIESRVRPMTFLESIEFSVLSMFFWTRVFVMAAVGAFISVISLVIVERRLAGASS